MSWTAFGAATVPLITNAAAAISWPGICSATRTLGSARGDGVVVGGIRGHCHDSEAVQRRRQPGETSLDDAVVRRNQPSPRRRCKQPSTNAGPGYLRRATTAPVSAAGLQRGPLAWLRRSLAAAGASRRRSLSLFFSPPHPSHANVVVRAATKDNPKANAQ